MENKTLSGPERPPLSGGKAQSLIILVHGLGADGNDLIGLVPLLAPAFPDAHFISPDAPFACDMAPMGRQWFSLRDWSPASMLKGATEAAPFLCAFADAQLKRFGLPESKLVWIGFSQGTMMSLQVALARPQTCGAVVGFSGALVAQTFTSKPPVCLVHGDADMVVPFQAMAMAEQTLKGAGVPVETHRRASLGHGIDPEGLDIATAFIKGKLA